MKLLKPRIQVLDPEYYNIILKPIDLDYWNNTVWFSLNNRKEYLYQYANYTSY